MIDRKTFLVVGAGGDLGHRIVDALLQLKLHVRVGVRGGSTGKHAEKVRRWAAAGAEVADMNLEREDSLQRGCQGVHTVISAVQGGPETIVDGQLRLASACTKAGVDRFLPSDYSEDFFSIPEGINPYLDARRTFAERVKTIPVEVVHLLNGGFMEAVFSSPGLIDARAGTLTYWGEGDIPLDFTALDDVAAFVARIANDAGYDRPIAAFAGDRCTIAGIVSAYETATDTKLSVVCRGSVADGYRELARMKAAGAPPMSLLPLQYLLPMMSGEGRLKQIANTRYPEVEPLSLHQFLAQQNGSNDAAVRRHD